jgi:hypothetical protein
VPNAISALGKKITSLLESDSKAIQFTPQSVQSKCSQHMDKAVQLFCYLLAELTSATEEPHPLPISNHSLQSSYPLLGPETAEQLCESMDMPLLAARVSGQSRLHNSFMACFLC